MNSLSQPARWEKLFWPVLTWLAFLTMWHIAVKLSGSKIFPSPLDVERGMAELARKGVLLSYIADSLRRVAVGYLSAAALGIPIGLLLGWYPEASRVVNPAIQIMRPISPIAWIPLAIIWFGVGDAAAMYLIFLGAFRSLSPP
jgi:NitT/TauT family transport system permease protein